MTNEQLDQLSINTIRTLSIDAVQQANPAIPARRWRWRRSVYTIWNRVMRFDPADPIWPNRDRFVLSNGHASMLLWSVLHLPGRGSERRSMSGSASRRSRSTTSATSASSTARPPAIPSITGSRASRRRPVRSARASPPASAWQSREKWLATRYNRTGFEVFDYNIYAVCGDGCLMEGVASEAASLAGHLGLDNLCWIYDNNHITIEGNTSIAFTEDVATRFLGYGWNVLRVGDANDIDRIEHAIEVFKRPRAGPLSSFSTATSATARRTSRTPPPRTASRSARRRSG